MDPEKNHQYSASVTIIQCPLLQAGIGLHVKFLQFTKNCFKKEFQVAVQTNNMYLHDNHLYAIKHF